MVAQKSISTASYDNVCEMDVDASCDIPLKKHDTVHNNYAAYLIMPGSN